MSSLNLVSNTVDMVRWWLGGAWRAPAGRRALRPGRSGARSAGTCVVVLLVFISRGLRSALVWTTQTVVQVAPTASIVSASVT